MTTLIIPKQESTANSVSIFLDRFVVFNSGNDLLNSVLKKMAVSSYE